MTTTTPTPDPVRTSSTRGGAPARGAAPFGPRQLIAALPDAFRKLDPRTLWRNPVMLLVEVGAVLVTVLAIVEAVTGERSGGDGSAAVPTAFAFSIAVWLWLTVLFANLAEAVAEGRGKAQADSLRKTRTSTQAQRVVHYDESDPDAERAELETVASADLRLRDVVVVTAGEVIPGDGDVVSGIASVDESAITGESAPVVRESGGDRSAVTGGTRVLSDRIVVRITSKPGETFVDRMIGLVEGASRQKTPNEIALDILLAALSIVFVVVVLTLEPIAASVGAAVGVTVLVALLVCLIPTTIGALLSAIGIAGMDRLVQRNVLAMSGRAVEAAGDITTLLLDKTGTITYGNRRATGVVPVSGTSERELLEQAALCSLGDPTPEGRSVVDLAAAAGLRPEPAGGEVVPFTAQTRMSGVDLPDGTLVRKGAAAAVAAWIGGATTEGLDEAVTAISSAGGTPLAVARREPDGSARVLGVIRLEDVVKEGIAERFAELRRMGIRTVMVTGDNPLTAAAIARQAGVDDHLAEATPEAKLELISREQEGGNLVAMTGDGTNDAPALAQADVGVAMNTGTTAAKEAGNMVDLDSDPTKLIDIVATGKQLLITRGALTTFSIANDLAKYFAIVPAMFQAVFPGLAVLNIMQLHSPASAILSAIIFNALVIVALIPLALRGVTYRAGSASSVLSRNLLVYGLGGVIVPFIGIKAIDLVVSLIPGF
jgi:potassium-transporting ATPase ATP-binding subunit